MTDLAPLPHSSTYLTGTCAASTRSRALSESRYTNDEALSALITSRDWMLWVDR